MKNSILENYKYVVLHRLIDHFRFVKDDKELRRLVDDMEVSDGDVVIQLNEEFIKMAVKHNYIKLV